MLLNGTAWSQIHTLTSTNIVTADLDGNGKAEVIINFGAAGLWEYANNTDWIQLHTVEPWRDGGRPHQRAVGSGEDGIA